MPTKKKAKSANDPSATIIEIIAQHLIRDETEVTPHTKLIDDLDADSLDRIEIIMTIEERFDLEIPETDADRMKTVEDVINYVKKHQPTA